MLLDVYFFLVYNLIVILIVYGKVIDKIVIKMIIIVFREMVVLKKKFLWVLYVSFSEVIVFYR